LHFYARQLGYPYLPPTDITNNDFFAINSPLTISTPAPGDWFIAIQNLQNTSIQSFNITSQPLLCNVTAGQGGPSCSDNTVVDLTAQPVGLMIKNRSRTETLMYYKYTVSPAENVTMLNFAVASLDGISPAPEVFVRWGNLPTTTIYDFKGCSTQFCFVNFVNLGVLEGANNNWFIGVLAYNASGDDFGIWRGDICPNDCNSNNNQGTCNTFGPKMGSCTCNTGYSLIDCSSSNGPIGFPVQYIVLIVMGSLVVLSALFGFIAWVYMKKKKHYEEIQ